MEEIISAREVNRKSPKLFPFDKMAEKHGDAPIYFKTLSFFFFFLKNQNPIEILNKALSLQHEKKNH